VVMKRRTEHLVLKRDGRQGVLARDEARALDPPRRCYSVGGRRGLARDRDRERRAARACGGNSGELERRATRRSC
jgi:hypothetical protein